MTITIKLKTDNAAFQDDKAGELRQILDRVRWLVAGDGFSAVKDSPLRDSNGNTVGSVTVTGR